MKRSAPAAFKKNVKLYCVIGCSRLTGSNDGDECDSVTYYACSFRGRYHTVPHFLKVYEISREVKESFQHQLMYNRSK